MNLTPAEFFQELCRVRPEAARGLMQRLIDYPSGDGFVMPYVPTEFETERRRFERELGAAIILRRPLPAYLPVGPDLSPEDFFRLLCERRPQQARDYMTRLIDEPDQLRYWCRPPSGPLPDLSADELAQYRAAKASNSLALLLNMTAPPTRRQKKTAITKAARAEPDHH